MLRLDILIFNTVMHVQVNVEDPGELWLEGVYAEDDVVDVAEAGGLVSLGVVPPAVPVNGHLKGTIETVKLLLISQCTVIHKLRQNHSFIWPL